MSDILQAKTITGEYSGFADSALRDVSGTFLTAVPNTYLQNTDLSTTDGKVTAISGIPLSAGSDVPEGVMVESGLEYDNTEISGYSGSAFKDVALTDVVTANSGAWGGSALPISAGPGIKFELVDNTLVASTDETVLWSTADVYKTTAFTLTERLTAFEKVRFEITGYTNVYAEDTHQTPSANDEEISTCFTYYCKSSDGNPLQMMMGTYTSTDGLNYGVARSKFLYMSNDGTTWNGNTTDGPHIQKIVGINRIAGGN